MLVLRGPAIVDVALRSAAGAAGAAAIAFLAYRLRALTTSGAIAAVIVGTLAFAFGGMFVAGAIVIFFVSGSLLGRIRGRTIDAERGPATKTGPRDAAQVFANGGVGVACAIIGAAALATASASAPRWMIAAVCSLAAVSGDTWSTEVGAFSRGPARLITNLRPVVAGTSGGITVLGTLAAPFGGSLVGLAGALRPGLLALPAWLALAAAAGLMGSIFDSVLGATVQGMWRCPNCAKLTESAGHCGGTAIMVRGLPWLDNDLVNGFTSLAGAALGYFLAGFRPALM